MWRASAQRSGKNTGGGDAGTDPVGTKGKYFKTMWFDDDLNGKILEGRLNRRRGRHGSTDTTWRPTACRRQALHDLYDENAGSDNGNIEKIWQHLTDAGR